MSKCIIEMFENKDLTRIYEPVWKGLKGGWRKWRNEELHSFTLHQVK